MKLWAATTAKPHAASEILGDGAGSRWSPSLLMPGLGRKSLLRVAACCWRQPDIFTFSLPEKYVLLIRLAPVLILFLFLVPVKLFPVLFLVLVLLALVLLCLCDEVSLVFLVCV